MAKMNKICIVCGLGRSGSTIVQRVLDSHPDIFISDESWYFFQAAHRYNSRNIVTTMGMDEHAFRHCLASHVLHLYAAVAHEDVDVFGDKCPPAVMQMDTIQHIMSSIGRECVFVTMIRHPYDQALSWITRFGDAALQVLTHYGLRPSKSVYSRYEVIQEIFRVWKTQCSVLGRANGVFEYEKLVTSPVATFGRIHALLGIKFCESQLSDAFTKRVVGGDPKFNDTRSIHTDSVYIWTKQDKNTRKRLHTCAERSGILEEMRRFGYMGD